MPSGQQKQADGQRDKTNLRYSKAKGLLNFKNNLQIPYVSHFICLLLTLYAKLKFKKMPACCWCKILNWGKTTHLPQNRHRDLLEISYILPLSVVSMTFHYHRPYQISSLEAEVFRWYKTVLYVARSYTNLPTPKLIIKSDLF